MANKRIVCFLADKCQLFNFKFNIIRNIFGHIKGLPFAFLFKYYGIQS